MTKWIDAYVKAAGESRNEILDDLPMIPAGAAPGCPDAGAARHAGRIKPDVPAQDLARAAYARKWRVGRGWTRLEIAALSGFSVSAVVDFERGYRLGHLENETVPASAWLRYGLICAALEAELDPLF